MYLTNITDLDVNFNTAVQWLKSKNVKVVSSSIGLNLKYGCKLLYLALTSPYSADYAVNQLAYLDQLEEQIDFAINGAVSNGITWSQAAGNDGQKKWVGWFYDPDGDGYQNFSLHENYNEIYLDIENHALRAWSEFKGFAI